MDQEGCDSSVQGHSGSAVTVTLHVHLQGQRSKSQPVPCAYELALREGIYIKVDENK